MPLKSLTLKLERVAMPPKNLTTSSIENLVQYRADLKAEMDQLHTTLAKTKDKFQAVTAELISRLQGQLVSPAHKKRKVTSPSSSSETNQQRVLKYLGKCKIPVKSGHVAKACSLSTAATSRALRSLRDAGLVAMKGDKNTAHWRKK